MALSADVQRDDPHRLAHRDDGEAALLRHALGRAVPRPGLGRLDRRVRQELDGGAEDAVGVAVEHDGAVHLRQLAQPRRGEPDVELETARAHLLDDLVQAQHDERAGPAAQDALRDRHGARCPVPRRRGSPGAARRGARGVGHGRILRCEPIATLGKPRDTPQSGHDPVSVRATGRRAATRAERGRLGWPNVVASVTVWRSSSPRAVPGRSPCHVVGRPSASAGPPRQAPHSSSSP